MAERRAQEAKAAQASSAEATAATPQPAEVKSEQPGQGAAVGPSPASTAGATGKSSAIRELKVLAASFLLIPGRELKLSAVEAFGKLGNREMEISLENTTYCT